MSHYHSLFNCYKGEYPAREGMQDRCPFSLFPLKTNHEESQPDHYILLITPNRPAISIPFIFSLVSKNTVFFKQTDKVMKKCPPHVHPHIFKLPCLCQLKMANVYPSIVQVPYNLKCLRLKLIGISYLLAIQFPSKVVV